MTDIGRSSRCLQSAMLIAASSTATTSIAADIRSFHVAGDVGGRRRTRFCWLLLLLMLLIVAQPVISRGVDDKKMTTTRDHYQGDADELHDAVCSFQLLTVQTLI